MMSTKHRPQYDDGNGDDDYCFDYDDDSNGDGLDDDDDGFDNEDDGFEDESSAVSALDV